MATPTLFLKLIIIVMSFIISKSAADKSEKRRRRSQKQLESRGIEIKANTMSSGTMMKKIYGMHRIGANMVYARTDGEDNKYLYFDHVLCDGEIEGIVNDDNGYPYIWFDGERIYEKYDGVYVYEEFTGTSTQQPSSLLQTFDYSTGEIYEEYMRYTAHVAWRLQYDPSIYTRGIPNIEYLVKGTKVYDFRSGSPTYGQYIWSDNPVLCLYDYMITSAAFDSSKLDETSFTEAADYCDVKGWTINCVLDIDGTSAWDNIQLFLKLFRGVLNDWDDVYYLRFADINEEAVVKSITDEHILQISNVAALSVDDPGNYEVAKSYKVVYISSENNIYNDSSFFVGDEEGLSETFDLYGCTSEEHAGQIALYNLERNQLNRTIVGTFRDDCIELEPFDLVEITSTALGFDEQLCRVVSTTIAEGNYINMVLQYESEALYNDVYDINPGEEYTTTLPDASDQILLSNVEITETQNPQRLRTFVDLEVTFDLVPANTPFIDHVEVWVSTDGNVDTNFKHLFNTSNDFTLPNAKEGLLYYILLRPVSIFGVKIDFSQADRFSHLVIGRSQDPPASLGELRATIGDGSLRLMANKLDDPDIEQYEFRVGTSWTSALFLTARRSPDIVINNITPGTHTFWCNTKGTNNIYGSTPRSVTVTIPIPHGWNYYDQFTDDYSAGVHDNTEQITYNGEAYLKCSHASESTSGSWISDEYDTGIAADTYMVIFNSAYSIVGEGTTWEDIFGNQTWVDIGADSRTWLSISETEEAPEVDIKLFYKEEAGHDWSSVSNMEISLAVVVARYFKVQIDIIDPSTNLNLYVQNFELDLYT